MRYGPFEFDAATRKLTRQGDFIHLTPKAFDLLHLLVDSAPRVVSKQRLHQHLWPNHAVTDATLVGLVKELRRALGDKDADARFIRTVNRIGYAFDAVSEPGEKATAPVGVLFVGERRIGLTAEETVIGRNASCDVCIDDATVSRRHARIVVGKDRITVEDLGSKNGTRIDGSEVVEGCALSDGVVIQFGDVNAVFRAAASNCPTVSRVDTT